MKSDLVALEKLRREKFAEQNRETEKQSLGNKNGANQKDTSYRQHNIIRKRRVFEKENGLGKESVFWDPLVNPFGVAPKGYKNVTRDQLKALKAQDKQSSEDNQNEQDVEEWIKNIPLPLGPKPGVDFNSDEELEYEKRQAEERVQITEYSSAPKLRDFVKEATTNLVPSALLRGRTQKTGRSTDALKLAQAQLKMNKEAEAARADEYSIGPKPPSSFTDSTDEVSVDHVGHSQTIGPIGPSVGDNYDNEYYDDPYYNDPFYDDDYEANDLQTSNAVPGSLESDTYHQQTAVTIGPQPPSKQPTLQDYGAEDYVEEYPRVSFEEKEAEFNSNQPQHEDVDDDSDNYDEFGNLIEKTDTKYTESSNLAPEEEEYYKMRGNKRKYEEEEEDII